MAFEKIFKFDIIDKGKLKQGHWTCDVQWQIKTRILDVRRPTAIKYEKI